MTNARHQRRPFGEIWVEAAVCAAYLRARILRALAIIALLGVSAETSTTSAGGHAGLQGQNKISIAVVPFVNMREEPQQEYFVDGITDHMISDLSKVSSLFVIARNSSFALRGRAINIRQITSNLGVDLILTGTVEFSGEKLAITIHLHDGKTGRTHWSDQFDGDMADMFTIQDKLVIAVLDALAAEITERERLALTQRDTEAPEAYDAFLRGWHRYQRQSPEDLKSAIAAFDEALRLDPQYGRAFAAAAMVYSRVYVWRLNAAFGIPRAEARLRAKKYLRDGYKYRTALSHQIAGLLYESDWNHAAAIEELNQAIELDPGDPWNHALMAFTLTSAGQPGEALPKIQLALTLDPYCPPFFMYILALTKFALGDYHTAASAAEESIRLGSEDGGSELLLASIYGHLEKTHEGLAAIARYNEIVVARGGMAVALSSETNCGLCPPLDLSKPEDSKRLFDGLRRIGNTDPTIDGKFSYRNMLKPQELTALLLGHKIEGWSMDTGEKRTAAISTDGTVSMKGDWAASAGGSMAASVMTNVGDDLCLLWSGTLKLCSKILQNPGGTKALRNEYIWYHGDQAFTFSLAD